MGREKNEAFVLFGGKLTEDESGGGVTLLTDVLKISSHPLILSGVCRADHRIFKGKITNRASKFYHNYTYDEVWVFSHKMSGLTVLGEIFDSVN